MPADSQTWIARLVTTVMRPLVRLIYKVKVEGLENLPREGGVIVAPNHLSYVDVVLLAIISPRPMRAMAWGGFQKYAIFRAIFRVFGVLPVSPKNARTALREAVEILKGGSIVLIFPEGQISRTGELLEFAGGFALLAKHSGCPVVPVHLEGLWGSIFSFEGGRFFWKWPKKIPFPVTITFGGALKAEEATVENLRKAMIALGPPPKPEPTAPPAPAEPSHQPAGKPLIDFGEAEFCARPELKGHLGEALVRALRRQAWDEVVVDYTGKRQVMKGGRLLAVCLALAARLRREVPEARVGIVLPPSLGGLIANYAVMLAGKTPVNLNFTIGKGALEASIRKAGVHTTITDQTFREKITARMPDLPWSERVLDCRTEIAALSSVALARWFIAAHFLPASWIVRRAGVPREGGDREAALLFTSGSSGEPKGVILTHRNILGNGTQIDASGIIPRGESLLGNLPIFHSFGFTITLWYAIQHGVKVVTVPSPLDVRKCIDAIKEEKISVLLGTPTFFRPYLKRVTEPNDMISLKYVVAGAEKTPAGFHEEWEGHFGSQYCEGYGLTETSPVVAVNLPTAKGDDEAAARMKKRPASVGKIFPGHAARIVDPETGAERGFDESGMLLLRGPNIFPGYLDQPDATAAAFKDGWFVTGDLAKIDPDGFLYIEGRLSRFSKIGGEMVPHGTVETAIIAALGLKGEAHAVAVASRPDEAKGEALVLLTTVDINADDLRAKLTAAGLANLWIPRIIKKVDAIPVLGTGKLDLRKIKELAKE